MRNYSIHNTVLKKRGHELDEMAQLMLCEQNEYVVIGFQEEISAFYERTGKYLKAVKPLVLNGQEHSELLDEIALLRNSLPVNEHTCIICTARERTIYEAVRNIDWWKDSGRRNEKSMFFQGELFSMIYEVYKKDEIKLDRVEIFLTSHCTLNCEKCIAYIPYFREKACTPLEQLKRDADILFHKVDYVYKLKLLGGEGLAYPHLIEYIDYLYDNYSDKIAVGGIRIGTNGTIFPGREILEMCKRNHVVLDISDYSAAVPEKCKIKEITALCEKNGVDVEIKRTGEQWLDLGFPNNIPEKKSEEQLREHFFNCAMFCRQFGNGRLYFCCSNYAAVRAGLFPENENDYFDFTSTFTKKELLEYEIGYSGLGHTTFCNVCRGCSEEANPCKVAVARQKSKAE